MSEPIKITINDSDELTAVGSVVADSVLYKRISFEFPEHWGQYLKTALFRNGDTAVDVILNADSPLFIEDNVYFIPHEVIKPPNFTVSVFGLNGTSTATSTFDVVCVKESGIVEGHEPLEPTPSEYEKIIKIGNELLALCNETKALCDETVALSNEAHEIAQSVRTDADNGVFNPVANYKWVKLTSGVLKSNAMHIYGDKYNGASVPLYGAAMKYKAPARSDGNNYMMYTS